MVSVRLVHDARHGRLALAAALLWASALACHESRPGSPLPEALHSRYWLHGCFAGMLFPLEDPSMRHELNCRVDFDTVERTVDLDWHFSAWGAAPGLSREHHDLGFEPTAFTQKAGIGPTVYFAGYIEQRGQVIVEQWDVEGIALESELPADDAGAPQSTFTKSIKRSVILRSTGVRPLKAIVYHFTSKRLWLFEEGAPHRVWALDPETGAVDVLFDEATMPELARFHSAWAFLVKPTVPDGGGFIIRMLPRRDWECSDVVLDDTDDEEVFIIRDRNLDGTTDSAGTYTWQQYDEILDYWSNIDINYH